MYGILCLILGVCIWTGRFCNIIQATNGLSIDRWLTGLLIALGGLFLLQVCGSCGEGHKVVCSSKCPGFSGLFFRLSDCPRSACAALSILDDLARLINARNGKADVVVFGFYPQDLPVYLGRTVNFVL